MNLTSDTDTGSKHDDLRGRNIGANLVGATTANLLSPMTLKVLIADDHPLFRGALALAVREIWHEAHIFDASNFTTLEAMAAANADLKLTLLDLNMPGAMGLSSLVYLRSEYPALPVAIISANDHPRIIRRAQQFGATAFVSKSSAISDIQEALRTVMDGGE